jgi:hypothetical protein
MKFLLLLICLLIYKLSLSTFGEFASAVNITTTSAVNYNTSGSGVNCINTTCSTVFDGVNFGSFVKNSGDLKLTGGEIKTWKDSWSNVCGGTLYYTIYLDGFRPGSPIFSSISLPFKANCSSGVFTDGIGPCGGNDQKWATFSSSIDLTAFNAGNYAIEVYFEYYGDDGSTSGCGTNRYISNFGSNYIAKYTLVDPVYLPIQLLNFGASCEADGVQIFWSTASENQTESFDIEKSFEGFNWQLIGSIPAGNNSTHQLNYFLQDEQARFSAYYRLKQTDLDGKFEYFDPIYLNCSSQNEYELFCFSNASAEIICVVSSGNKISKKLQLQSFNLLGQLIFEQDFDVKSENIMLHLNQSFASGMYLIHLVDDQSKEVIQTLKYIVN